MADVRDRYEAYLEARERELLLFRSGRQPLPKLHQVYDTFADVTSGDCLDDLAREHEAEHLEAPRQELLRLLHAVQDAVGASGVLHPELQLWERERSQRFRVGERDAEARVWAAQLAEESQASKRTELQLGLDRAWAELNPLREELFTARGEQLARLGYATRRAWAEARRPGVDYELWGTAATRLLDETASVHADALREAFAAVGVAPAAAHLGDVLRVERLADHDKLFPADKSGAVLAFTLEGMGVPLDRLPGLAIDLVERAGKQAAPFCLAPRVPEEVVLVGWPRSGVPAHAGLLHETGRALQFLYTSPSLSVVRRRSSDLALEEAWGALLSARLADPVWIETGPPAARAESYRPASWLRRCSELRRCAARVRFELELSALEAAADPTGLDAVYAEELSEATGCRWGAEGYLLAAAPTLSSVDCLRGWCLEAQLSELLRERFGRRFWRERAAGDLLKELWNTGATYSVEEIASQLGLGALDIDLLIETCLAGTLVR